MELRKQAKEESIKVIRLDFQVIELSSQCSYIFVLDPVRHACSFCMPFGIENVCLGCTRGRSAEGVRLLLRRRLPRRGHDLMQERPHVLQGQ